jgi:glycosyltransferase involved in cell wall biosynthesis
MSTKMYRNKSIAVIIPAYNEEKTITEVINAIPNFVDTIVVIDDCSTDNTVQKATEAGAEIIKHHFNQGVGAVFHSGVEYVLDRGFDIAVNIDADGQFSPSDIPLLIDPIIDVEADFVTASRFIDSSYTPDMPWINRWGNKQMSRLISALTSRRFYDVSCGFRAYSRDTLMKLNLIGRFTYTQETFLDLVTLKRA